MWSTFWIRDHHQGWLSTLRERQVDTEHNHQLLSNTNLLEAIPFVSQNSVTVATNVKGVASMS